MASFGKKPVAAPFSINVESADGPILAYCTVHGRNWLEMSGNVPMEVLRIIREIEDRVANGSLASETARAQLQTIVEQRPLEQSSLGNKVINTHEGVELTEAFLAQTMVFRGQAMKRHRNGGGWVPAEQDEDDLQRSFVAESAYVGPFAQVTDNARVTGNAWVHGKAEVYDNARVTGNAWVHGKAEVYDNAWVHGKAEVYGNARVHGKAEVRGRAWVHGNDRICF